ncbi:MAG: HlyD family efflux transporter periplasmic adaptor subunit [Chitinispirillaceae bacterium]|nr:HlyD family efflux transporter periplasmic adaptor subunit [Chitinispirillaceae bacterium]
MKTFYAVCLSVFLVLLVITMSLRSDSTSFYGVADAQELVINDEQAVEIKKIMVVPGQEVKSGDTLLAVAKPDLDHKIAEIRRQLNELQSRKSAHVNLSQSEILRFKSQQEARIGELKAQIKELEAQYDINRKLVSELRSIDTSDRLSVGSDDTANPVMIKIQQLKRELALAQDTAQIDMRRLKGELSYAGDPLAEQVKGLTKEMAMLMEEKDKLYKIAHIDGLIGAVNFKEGEKVSPFTPIVTLHTESPSYILGYIHENAYSKVYIGQKVMVSSLDDRGHSVSGEVVGVGSRIVEYPVRLRKSQDMQLWGREVTIRIPDNNTFLLGEKVMISLKEEKVLGAAKNQGVDSLALDDTDNDGKHKL